MRDDESLVAAIRDLVSAMAFERALSIVAGSVCRCGLPMTRYTDCGVPFCDDHTPSFKTGLTETPSAPLVRRLMKASRMAR